MAESPSGNLVLSRLVLHVLDKMRPSIQTGSGWYFYPQKFCLDKGYIRWGHFPLLQIHWLNGTMPVL